MKKKIKKDEQKLHNSLYRPTQIDMHINESLQEKQELQKNI
jgi:hypothetical protein